MAGLFSELLQRPDAQNVTRTRMEYGPTKERARMHFFKDFFCSTPCTLVELYKDSLKGFVEFQLTKLRGF